MAAGYVGSIQGVMAGELSYTKKSLIYWTTVIVVGVAIYFFAEWMGRR